MLLITHSWKEMHFGGRQQYSRCLIKSLNKNNYKDFKIYNINPYIKQSFFDKFLSLKTDNISDIDMLKIIQIIKKDKIKIIIIDCSSFGLLCKKIKHYSKDVKIIIIHQHIECVFFLKLFYNTKNIKKLLLTFKMYINEFLSTKYSDKQIFLTKKDCNQGKFLFRSKNTEILPIAQSATHDFDNDNYFKIKKPYILFVGGGGMIHNHIGIQWFIRKVLQKIDFSLVVVGSDYEELVSKKFKKVFFLGKVNNLTSLYKDSEFVIAPIFSGTGMKTKVAEATGYGKTTFATNEAMLGYEKFENQISIRCENESDFINNIKNYKKLIYDEKKVLEVFQKNYSIEAMSSNFNQLIKNLI